MSNDDTQKRARAEEAVAKILRNTDSHQAAVIVQAVLKAYNLVEPTEDERMYPEKFPDRVPADGVWEVWAEGYRVMEGTVGAMLVGECRAETFREACDEVMRDSDTYNREKLTLWGCRLFSFESEARLSFG